MKTFRNVLVGVLAALALAAAATAGTKSSRVVVVSTVDEIREAVQNGADRISVEPGVYLFTEPINLKDVELQGKGKAGSTSEVRFVMDPTSPALASSATLLVVSGRVLIENIAFEGLEYPVSRYIASNLAGQGTDRHQITIRACRFVSHPDFFGEESVLLGNILAHAPTNPSWDISFTDNYVQGGVFGLAILNVFSDAPDARINAKIERNEFRNSIDDALLVIGAVGGSHGTVTGTSKDNIFSSDGYPGDPASGFGLTIIGGSDVFAPNSGGSLAKVDWMSISDRFVDNRFAVAVWGGHRHANDFGPSMGNQVRVNIVSPQFENSALRDVDIEGASAYDTLPANAIDGTMLGAGNTVEVNLRQSDFEPTPGRVWIKNADTDSANSGRFDSEVPPMPTEPNYGNLAIFTGSPQAFEQTNPGVNQIPAAYFKGGEEVTADGCSDQ